MTLALSCFGLLGLFSIGVALVLLARLSQRIGYVMASRPYYRGLYVAAVLVWMGMLGRGYVALAQPPVSDAVGHNLVYTLFNDGLPALGVTIGLGVVWYYWSWLLAERD